MMGKVVENINSAFQLKMSSLFWALIYLYLDIYLEFKWAGGLCSFPTGLSIGWEGQR